MALIGPNVWSFLKPSTFHERHGTHKPLLISLIRNSAEKKEWVKAIEDCIAETSKKKRFFEDNINKVEKRRVSGGINVNQNN